MPPESCEGLNTLRCDQAPLWPVSPEDTKFILFKQDSRIRLWKDSLRLYLNLMAKQAMRNGREVAYVYHAEQLTSFKKLTFFDNTTTHLSRKFKK